MARISAGRRTWVEETEGGGLIEVAPLRERLPPEDEHAAPKTTIAKAATSKAAFTLREQAFWTRCPILLNPISLASNRGLIRFLNSVSLALRHV
jgi:hypothetical protein